ncbi:hypothetical protein BBJ29_007260 [Phytophthora kernoviae]|uniref:Uncharacterized protein n=1 Tax=Phytophthora kernoviae TaxID=325452 RepID=A0A3R7JML6_9STRA|nr:hypothetical protein BBJ29_007260 [Phytophthora kernoviae]
MSFFQRLVSYVINDVAVKALSNSRTFQRFALKTHYHMEDAKTMASTGAGALKNSFENYAPKVKEFGQAFRDEVAKDCKVLRWAMMNWLIAELRVLVRSVVFNC